MLLSIQLENKDKILVMKDSINLLLVQTLWGECSICNNEEIRVILDCVKNRIEHKDFPDSLDVVLTQSSQFSISKEIVPVHFTKKIDSLWKLPKKYPYLYFRSRGYKYSRWMKYKKWIKLKHFKHEFGK